MKLFNQARGVVMFSVTFLGIFAASILFGLLSILTNTRTGPIIDKYFKACVKDYRDIICTGIYVTPRMDKLAKDYFSSRGGA